MKRIALVLLVIIGAVLLLVRATGKTLAAYTEEEVSPPPSQPALPSE